MNPNISGSPVSKSPQNSFNPDRLSLARKRRKLTQKELAEKAGLSPVTVSRLMGSLREPEDDTLWALANALDFPLEFFYGNSIDEPTKEGASFRSLSTITARERDAALSAGALSHLLSDWADSRFSLPKPDLLDLSYVKDPATAAEVLRQYWDLGQRPVSHMINLIESKGIRVFSITENTKTVDAFSEWRNEQPFIFVNTFKTSERSRFDAAHELGHLVLHRHGGPGGGRKVEKEANDFASAFLMPENDILARIRRVTHLDALIPAKKRWGVSLAALVYRLHDLGILSDWQSKMFFIQIRKEYGPSEPNEITRETSIIWDNILKLLWKKGKTKKDIATELHIPAKEIDSLLFANLGERLALKDEKDNGKPRLRLA